MGFYTRTIFPRLCDLMLDQPLLAEHRSELLSGVGGRILEIGFGTGLNLRHYPEQVQRIVTVDPNPGMHRQARRRIGQTAIEVDQRLLGSEQLPFEEGEFDCVVSTFTLCSIERVERALEELYRVLTPDGKFFVLEHGLSPEPAVQKWQRRLNWLQRRIADNCHLDRNIRELVRQQPFRAIDLDEFYLEKTPRTHGYLYQGVAIK